MNIQTEIKNIIEKAVKQAIDELAIKEQIRDFIASAVTKEEISKRTDALIDSYFRSAMNQQSVEIYIQQKMHRLVDDKVQEAVSKIIDGTNSWRGRELLRADIERKVQEELRKSYDITVSIKERSEE